MLSEYVEGAGVQGVRLYTTAPFELTYHCGVGLHRLVGASFLEGSEMAWQCYRPDLAPCPCEAVPQPPGIRSAANPPDPRSEPVPVDGIVGEEEGIEPGQLSLHEGLG